MTAAKYLRVIVLVAAALAALGGGCRKEKAACTLRQAKEDSAAYVATSRRAAEDATDADRRRFGVVLLSDHSWGRREPYTAYYARLLGSNGDEPVRAAAATALGVSGDAKYLGNLAAAMTDRSSVVRQDTAAALGRLRGDAGLAALRRAAAEDSSDDVRSAVATSLGNYRQPEAAGTLLRCMKDRAFAVRHAARAALVRLSGKDYGDDPANWTDWANRSAASGLAVRDGGGWDPFAWMKNR
jgi:HEAT repeat protein